MNIARFLEHWSITENPFKAEEARHDAVFARLPGEATAHPDFEKIVGDLSRPSASIVFGEKGSGKTAIRLQLARRIAQHNEKHPDAMVFLVAYDDLNPMLDHFIAAGPMVEDEGGKAVLKRLKSLTLSDHLDGLLATATPRMIDLVLGEGPGFAESGRRDAGASTLRKSPTTLKRSLQILQALYDRSEGYEWRARALRRRIAIPMNRSRLLWKGLALAGWIPAAAVAAASFYVSRDLIGARLWLYAFYVCLAVWGMLLANWVVLQPFIRTRLSKRLLRRLRTVPRQHEALARTIAFIPPEDRAATLGPFDESDERRYAMIAPLREALKPLGYRGIVVIVDRLDEPTVISGDPDRMRAVAWPLLSNKFLQQEGVGVKLLLPAELRHELFRESSAFFQEARLDKQNLVERLSWTGATLYDLCNARLRACHATGPSGSPLTLTDLFEDDVTRQDIVDALDQMHQPRDAFKLLYQCMQEHCSNVTEEQGKWRIPRLVLETVRKQQAERVQMLYRGFRPA